MEKRNIQLEHGQPMDQTRGLFCMCESGVAGSQSRHQYELDVRSVLHGQVSFAAANQILCNPWGFERLQKSNNSCSKKVQFWPFDKNPQGWGRWGGSRGWGSAVTIFASMLLHSWFSLIWYAQWPYSENSFILTFWSHQQGLLCFFFLSFVWYAFVRVCLYVLCGHLLGKGWPLGSCLWCLIVSLSLSHWYPGSGVVLDCIDSWSLQPY